MSSKPKTAALVILVLAAAAPGAGQDIVLGGPGDGDYSLWFFDDGSATGQRFYWDDFADRFHLTGDLEIDGDEIRFGSAESFFDAGSFTIGTSGHLQIGGWLLSDTIDPGSELGVLGHLSINSNGTDGTRSLCFRDSSSCDKHLSWNGTDGVFEFDDKLHVTSALHAGSGDIGATGFAYNAFGFISGSAFSGPESGEITSDDDVFVSDDLEVDGQLHLSAQLYMEGAEDTGFGGSQTIWFYDGGDRQANYLEWEGGRNDSICSGTSATDSAFVWNIKDDTNSAWMFTNDDDIEFKFDEDGDMALDGSLTESGSCDIAETFIGPELEPGTVVVLSLDEPEAVVESTTSYDELVVGVVSTDPGILLNGPTADFYELRDEIERVEAAYRRHPGDLALEGRLREFEALRDGWRRGNLPIALAGRVPVKVDGSYGVIRAGDKLTTSPTPGHAMVMNRPGPTIGVALEEFDDDLGKVLMLVKPGWYVPPAWLASSRSQLESRAVGAALDAASSRIAELEARLLRLESLSPVSAAEWMRTASAGAAASASSASSAGK